MSRNTIESLIGMWEAELKRNRWLMGPSTIVQIEHTIKRLKEWQESKAAGKDGGN